MDVRPGFLGAYFHQGMEHPALVQLASELSSRFSRIICGRPIHMIWAYSYDTEHNSARQHEDDSGIHLHADPAAVNINLWITEDEASLDLDRGGMVVYEGVPLISDNVGELRFDQFNGDPHLSRAWVEGRQREGALRRVAVPHRANRMVLFDSMLFHETDVMRFRKGHAKRRINLTFLFGQVGQACVPQYFGGRGSKVENERRKASPFVSCGAGRTC
jgi:hypothetical protein